MDGGGQYQAPSRSGIMKSLAPLALQEQLEQPGPGPGPLEPGAHIMPQLTPGAGIKAAAPLLRYRRWTSVDQTHVRDEIQCGREPGWAGG